MMTWVLIGTAAAAVAAAAVGVPLLLRGRRTAARRRSRRVSGITPPGRRSASGGPAPVGMRVVRSLALDLSRCLNASPAEAMPAPISSDAGLLAAARAAVLGAAEGLGERRRILEALASGGQDTLELTGLIQGDPELEQRILARINGPGYQLDAPIEQITRAAVFLGHTEVRLQTWRACLDDVIRPSSSMTARVFEQQWLHAFAVARTAQALCANAALPQPELIVTAGLLHDIGKLLALARWPDRARAFDHVRFSLGPALTSEVARIGVCHPHLGAEFCDMVGLPSQVGRLVQNHHLPSYAPPSGSDSLPEALATVHLADVLSHTAQAHLTGSACAGIYPPADGWFELLKADGLEELLTQNVVLALLDPAVVWRGAPGADRAA